MKLVSDWRECWRWFSTQAMALAGAIQGAWVLLPDDMKASIAPSIVSGITLTLLVFGIVGRLVDQK